LELDWADCVRLLDAEERRPSAMTKIFVDADACPVKNETYAIAKRLNLIVHVVANQ
jgi:hypothetical protein